MGTTYLETDRRFGRSTALVGDEGGKYPYGNSLLVEGPDGTVLVDPSLSLVGRGGVPAERVDHILVSHAHEDHMAGVHLFPGAAVHAHHDDLLGVHSLEGFETVYGMPSKTWAEWCPQMLREFHYVERPDATGFADGDRFDLGAGIVVDVVHLAGHTRGHCGFLVDHDGVFFCADVDLTGFGPYYGDHWSNLDDFEDAIARCRTIEARHYVTFHQKGVIDGRETFVRMLDDYAAVIARRDEAMLAFLAAPRTVDEMVEHRFVYRPHVDITFADHVERRTAEQHLARFVRRAQAVEIGDGRYAAA